MIWVRLSSSAVQPVQEPGLLVLGPSQPRASYIDTLVERKRR